MGEPSDDSVEVCIYFLQVIGKELSSSSPKGLEAIFKRLRNILHEGIVSKRVQIQLEKLIRTKQDGFLEYPSVMEELDLVEEDDQITFELSLLDDDDDDNIMRGEEYLDVFRYDDHFEENELVWNKIRDEILGVDDSDSDDDSASTASSSSSEEDDEQEEEQPGEE